MKLYHGSTLVVDKPLVSFGRDNLDFGKGFYTTSMQSQAEKWVQRFISLGKKGNIDEEKAMEFFYKSNTYMLMSKGISDFHCLSDAYLVEEIMLEQELSH